MPEKSTVDLEFLLGEGRPVCCTGKIAWVNRGQLESYPPGFGVEFLDLETGAIDRILECYEDVEPC